jgi:hypothetical protein
VGDILERILVDLRDKKIAHRLSFSEACRRSRSRTRSSSPTCGWASRFS